jgi:hypothetical protein
MFSNIKCRTSIKNEYTSNFNQSTLNFNQNTLVFRALAFFSMLFEHPAELPVDEKIQATHKWNRNINKHEGKLGCNHIVLQQWKQLQC